MIYYDSYRIVADTMEELFTFAKEHDVPENYFTDHPIYAHYIYKTDDKDTQLLAILKATPNAKKVKSNDFIVRAYVMNKGYKK